MSKTERFRVPTDLDGVRSDKVISVVLDISRGDSRKLIDAGDATVAGRPLRPSEPLSAGTEVTLVTPEPRGELVPAEVDFTVVHEDDAVLVVSKPAGVVVHPGAGTTEPTLVAGLVKRFPELTSMEEHRWGLVHRLDRDTSGLLTVARWSDAHERLQDALRRREIRRTYLALIAGRPDGATGTIDSPIGRDPNNPTRMALRHDGRHARTHYRRLAVWDDVSLVEVSLETGRTHQIRVHFAGIGHPVVGDRTYGGRANRRGDPGRQWLHALRLEFAHPVSDDWIAVDDRVAPDLISALRALGDPGAGMVPPNLLA